MNPVDDPFGSGSGPFIAPKADEARQAIASLRGYAYQVMASALAWVDIGERDHLFLEVAEDYAVVAKDALEAVQARDTAASGRVTLGSGKVREAVSHFVDLAARNPGRSVSLRYLTTSEEGRERLASDRPEGMPGLTYWRRAAAGADVTPLRRLLESDAFSESVREFTRQRDDDAVREDLLRRIHWDCGRPDLPTLRKELTDRVTVVGRNLFGLPARDAPSLSDEIAFHVLQRSILGDPGERVLGKADLYRLMGRAAEVVLTRSAFGAILKGRGSGLNRTLADVDVDHPAFAAADPHWLVDGDTIPSPARFVPRSHVEGIVTSALSSYGCAILTGATGLGKSHLARTVAARSSRDFLVVDFRDADEPETRRRLDGVFRRVGGSHASVYVFEDLNHLDAPEVSSAFGRVMEALRRRDRTAVVTCYEPPSARGMATIALDTASVVACPYFTEKETEALVEAHGGEPSLWGRISYFAAAFGHPRLLHAFVLGMSQRDWPPSEISAVIASGLTSDDVAAERDVARRRLIAALPGESRTLLARLSLLIGSFDRTAALTVGRMPEPIPEPSGVLDTMIGPWIERMGRDRFRLSPLASGLGRAMLAPEHQTELHAGIARYMLSKRTLEASDVDVVLVHSMFGRVEDGLVAMSMAILDAVSDDVQRIASSVTVLRFLDPVPLLDFARPAVTSLLRLAQFKLLDAAGEGELAATAARAAMDAASSLDGMARTNLEAMLLSVVLLTIGVANNLDDWVAWLVKFKLVLGAPDLHEDIRPLLDNVARKSDVDPFAVFFGIGTYRLSSVERLERVVDGLSELEPADRDVWLAPTSDHPVDYALFVNGPWVEEERRGGFDAADAAERYARIAQKTHGWEIPDLAMQAWIARAVMLDEYLDRGDEALAILGEAASVFDDDPRLLRAIAKVHWRRADYPKALELLRGIADVVGRGSPVERAFALREAAISSANCGGWQQAETWFRDARVAALELRDGDMRPMAIGLHADAAVAAVRSGDRARGLADMAEALDELGEIDPASSLKAAYCHRVVRHAILWMQTEMDGSEVLIDGKPIVMAPGGCSNPDPPPTIVELPLGHMDLARYMLAEAEAAAGVDVGMGSRLEASLSGVPIPMMEMGVLHRRMWRSIESLDDATFVTCLDPYVDVTVHIADQRGRLGVEFDVMAPTRGHVPIADPSSPLARSAASDAIIAFGANAVYARGRPGLGELHERLLGTYGAGHHAHALFGTPGSESGVGLPTQVKRHLDGLDVGISPAGDRLWLLSLFLLEHHRASAFRNKLFPRFETWLRASWRRVLRERAFTLFQPLRTVPPIEAAMAMDPTGEASVATLLLGSADAVRVRVGTEVRDLLRASAGGTR